jgi:CIC family chloride channel protein
VDTSLVVLAALVGTIGGWVVVAMSVAVAALHAVLFNIDIRDRLSSQFSIDPLHAVLVPSLGGLVLGLGLLLLQRWRRAKLIRSRPTPCMAGGCRSAAV